MKGDTGSFVEGPERGRGLLKGARVGSPNNTPEQIRKAQLFVASQAKDAEDCALLLDVLGLMPAVSEKKAS